MGTKLMASASAGSPIINGSFLSVCEILLGDACRLILRIPCRPIHTPETNAADLEFPGRFRQPPQSTILGKIDFFWNIALVPHGKRCDPWPRQFQDKQL